MTFGKLIEDMGKNLGVELVDEGGATVVEVDGSAIAIHAAGADLLLIHADMGEIPPESRDAVLAAAMEANFLYQGTGGATFARDPANGHLHLQRYDWLARLDADRAADALTRFADTIAAWRRIAADLGQAPSAEQATSDKKESPSAPGAASEGDFIKV